MSDAESEGSFTGGTASEYDDLSLLANQIVEGLNLVDVEENTPSKPSDLHLSDGSIDFQARSYQLEMLEESLKRNIIIAVCLPKNFTSLETNLIRDGHRIWYVI